MTTECLLFLCVHRAVWSVCLGVCLGLQCAVIEFARNVLGWIDAHSTEADATTTHPVVRRACNAVSVISPLRELAADSFVCLLMSGNYAAKLNNVMLVVVVVLVVEMNII